MTTRVENIHDRDVFERLGPFVHSKVFATLFAQGMELVEETATYLDNAGRKAAKQLDREGAMVYAGVSMRLTTRLMQIASWLLVLRAVRDGEMTEVEAGDDKYRLGMPEPKTNDDNEKAILPEPLLELISDADTLYARISRLDTDLFTEPATDVEESDVKGQMALLEKAFLGPSA